MEALPFCLLLPPSCLLLPAPCAADYRRECAAMILSVRPGAMVLLDRRFHVLIFATLVSKSCAIENRVSPRFTLYVTCASCVDGWVARGDSAASTIAREATADGA